MKSALQAQTDEARGQLLFAINRIRAAIRLRDATELRDLERKVSAALQFRGDSLKAWHGTQRETAIAPSGQADLGSEGALPVPVAKAGSTPITTVQTPVLD